MHESSILNIAFQVRKTLNDFIDCLIISSAISQCDALITEDADIRNIEEDESFREIIAMRNPKFRIRKLAEILRHKV